MSESREHVHQAELEMRAAQARLEVMESVAPYFGMAVGVVVYLWTSSWFFTVVAAIVAWQLIERPFGRAYTAASDAYERLTETGPYSPRMRGAAGEGAQ